MLNINYTVYNFILILLSVNIIFPIIQLFNVEKLRKKQILSEFAGKKAKFNIFRVKIGHYIFPIFFIRSSTVARYAGSFCITVLTLFVA